VTEPTQLSYTDALAELEGILSGLERDELDVDVLAERVARAAELIKSCRDRIDRARLEVERVVTDLGVGEQ
jgi:exodeoxyribonuclease VII small subunit